MSRIAFVVWLSGLLAGPGLAAAQEPATASPAAAALVVTPARLTLQGGETARLTAVVRDGAGQPVEAPVVFFSEAPRSAEVTADGLVTAHRAGTHTIVALVPRDPDIDAEDAETIVRAKVTVTVSSPPVRTLQFTGVPPRWLAGTAVGLSTRVLDEAGDERPDVSVTFESANPAVAAVDRLGRVALGAPGSTTLTARAGEASATLAVTVEANPVRALDLAASAPGARTGDVVRFTAVARDAQGQPVADAPILLAVESQPAPGLVAPGATAQVEADGRFVAERPGRYTVVAVSGPYSARATVDVASRGVRRRAEFVGQGAVRDRHTSDLWVWTAPNGRDYAITGTWSADGHAYIWDVTDPTAPRLVDLVRVDARTVNDVKVSEDGRIAVISREGASNRRNGMVLLDVSNPEEGVRVLSRYDDQLTGGVHNVFIHQQHVYAVSNGRRFDVISIEDPAKPVRVGRFELDTPGHGIHDVWVVDGIAYSSNWEDGVVAIDVGGGGRGGTPANPVELGRYKHPNGWNHAAFPFRSQSTGKFYVFMSDEAFPDPTPPPGYPERPAGWIHVIEWDDWARPREVARYDVPEAGVHNLWVEGDVLYVAYYNGGLRVVDVSGELMGDLYRQGREIASFKAFDPQGFVKNAPMTWGPQPFKDHIFFSEHYSGLWVVKLGGPVDTAAAAGEPRD